jgi:hypothetical protein
MATNRDAIVNASARAMEAVDRCPQGVCCTDMERPRASSSTSPPTTTAK